MSKTYAYIGSYTSAKRGGLGTGGISVFCKENQKPWREIQVYKITNPSFLSFGKDRKYLYSVQGDGTLVSAYSIGEDGSISLINQKSTGYVNGVHCEVTPDCRYILVSSCNQANRSGAVVSIALSEDGSLGDIKDILVPNGNLGPLCEKIQAGVKPHQTRVAPDGKFVIEIDKGLDALNTYTFSENGQFTHVGSMNCRPASCPRHIAFSPDGSFLYLLTEFFGHIVACRYQAGTITPLAVYPTLPTDFLGLKNSAAEIAVHPSGKWLYASNREHNSLVRFRIEENGMLCPATWFTDGICKPRFFTISDDGQKLYCANEASHCVSVYAIDQQDGALLLTDEVLRASAPACVLLNSITD